MKTSFFCHVHTIFSRINPCSSESSLFIWAVYQKSPTLHLSSPNTLDLRSLERLDSCIFKESLFRKVCWKSVCKVTHDWHFQTLVESRCKHWTKMWARAAFLRSLIRRWPCRCFSPRSYSAQSSYTVKTERFESAAESREPPLPVDLTFLHLSWSDGC